MSKADEMFEKLGYKKEEHNYKNYSCISYENEEKSAIDFMIDEKIVKIWEIALSMQELQAINEKVKELKWI